MNKDHAELHLPHRERLLTLLQDGRWHPHHELAKVAGVRYGARLHELRRLGHEIEIRDDDPEKDGRSYRLTGRRVLPKEKMVKVYLPELEADALLIGFVGQKTKACVRAALESFRRNKEKL